MSAWHRPLQAIRRAPEPWKRRLRPLFMRSMVALHHFPGGKWASAAVRRLMPGLHAWLRRRYFYYADSQVVWVPPVVPVQQVAVRLEADTSMVLGWLRHRGSEQPR
jgi:hypothetical protein